MAADAGAGGCRDAAGLELACVSPVLRYSPHRCGSVGGNTSVFIK